MSTDTEIRYGNVITAFLQSIPEERREELRARVKAALARQEARRRGEAGAEEGDELDRLLAEDDDPDHDPATAGARPLPRRDAAENRRTADLIMLAGLQGEGRRLLAAAEAPAASPPPAPATGDGGGSGNRHVIPLSDIPPEPLRWLSPGRLAAGKITILDGDPGLGKSTLLCELAARVSQGDALPGGRTEEPRSVLLMSAEDDLRDTIRPRLDAAGGDPARVIALTSLPDGTTAGRPFVIPGDAPWLEMFAHQLDVALIIIDPLVAFLERGLSANNDQDVRLALASLKAVGERTGAAIVAVRHLNKATGGNPLYRGGGSIGIIGAARCGLLLAADPEDGERRILAPTKGNLARPPAALAFRLVDVPGAEVARVVWEGESRWTAAALLRAAEDEDRDETRSALEEARAFLRAALADGPRPAKEVQAEAEARGIAVKTLRAARKAEGIVARKEQSAHGQWLVALPETEAVEGEDGKEGQPPLSLHLSPLSPLSPLCHDDDQMRPPSSVESEAVLDRPWQPHLAETDDDAEERRCVACGEGLAPWETGARCGPCLAKAWTDDVA
jgi:hypothetical protein